MNKATDARNRANCAAALRAERSAADARADAEEIATIEALIQATKEHTR